MPNDAQITQHRFQEQRQRDAARRQQNQQSSQRGNQQKSSGYNTPGSAGSAGPAKVRKRGKPKLDPIFNARQKARRKKLSRVKWDGALDQSKDAVEKSQAIAKRTEREISENPLVSGNDAVKANLATLAGQHTTRMSGLKTNINRDMDALTHAANNVRDVKAPVAMLAHFHNKSAAEHLSKFDEHQGQAKREFKGAIDTIPNGEAKDNLITHFDRGQAEERDAFKENFENNNANMHKEAESRINMHYVSKIKKGPLAFMKRVLKGAGPQVGRGMGSDTPTVGDAKNLNSITVNGFEATRTEGTNEWKINFAPTGKHPKMSGLATKETKALSDMFGHLKATTGCTKVIIETTGSAAMFRQAYIAAASQGLDVNLEKSTHEGEPAANLIDAKMQQAAKTAGERYTKQSQSFKTKGERAVAKGEAKMAADKGDDSAHARWKGAYENSKTALPAPAAGDHAIRIGAGGPGGS